MIRDNSITAAFFKIRIITLSSVILVTVSIGFTAFFSILAGVAQCSVYGYMPSYSVALPAASSIFSPLFNQGGTSQSYYYPSQSSSSQSPAFSNGFYIPGNPGNGYSYPSSSGLTLSFRQQSSTQVNSAGQALIQGEYYLPSINSQSFPGSGIVYRTSTNSYYYPAQTASFSSGNYGASSTGFYYPAQTASFSSGNYGSNNSIFAPLTSFFASSQPSSYSYINGGLITWPVTGTRTIAAVAARILANATRGMDGWDPVAWLNAGFQVGIWAKVLPVRAQSMDIQGLLLANTPAFSVRPTGQTGSMTLLRADVSLYEGLIDASAGAGDYLTTVTVDAASATPVIYRRNFTCDACHPTPPGHIATPAIWGKCNQCHNLSSNIHIHAYNAGIAADNCYQCHPTGSLNSVHSQQIGLWCIDCHGTLLDAPNNQMNISGQLGLPHCADCHDLLHSENLPALFADSVGHGGLWCSNCHGPVHAEISTPLGYKNCRLCHTTQASLPSMGPNCQKCHSSSISPHLVK